MHGSDNRHTWERRRVDEAPFQNTTSQTREISKLEIRTANYQVQTDQGVPNSAPPTQTAKLRFPNPELPRLGNPKLPNADPNSAIPNHQTACQNRWHDSRNPTEVMRRMSNLLPFEIEFLQWKAS